MQNLNKDEEIPKEMLELLSYISEMKRNHVIMAKRLDNAERDIELLKRKCKNADIL
jgi:hypothetical protein